MKEKCEALIKALKKVNYIRLKQKVKKRLLGMQLTDGILIKVIIYGMLISLGFVFLYPILYMVITSLKSDEDIMNTSLKWIPNLLEFKNYADVLKALKLIKTEKFILNSLFQTTLIAGIPAICTLISASLAGYGFSRFRFPFKNVLFALMIATFIIAPQILAIPRFVWYKDLNLITISTDTPIGLFDLKGYWLFYKPLLTYILPALLGQGINSALFILIFWSMFNMIPKSLEEAAKIDGASNIKIYTKIAIPLSKAGFIIVFLFSFVWYWNETYLANFYFGQSNLATLPMQLQRYISGVVNPNSGQLQRMLFQPEKMAATLIIIIPLLILYFSLQRYFVESIDRSGITGE
jgi:multiple sugar transport system permease protein